VAIAPARAAETPSPAAAPAAPTKREGFLHEVGDLMIFSAQALRALPGSTRYFSEALRQAADMLLGTLVLLFFMEVFLGVTSSNFAFFLLRTIGASDFTGLVSGYGGPRQLTPQMFGYVFAGRICCGITAELGAMRIQQEVAALETSGVDPMRYLVGTRLLGILLFVPIGAVVALLAFLAGVYFNIVVVLKGVAPHVLLDVNWSVQTISNQMVALVVMATTGVLCGLVACFYGLRTRGGPAAVGSSVARALTINLVLGHMIGVFFAVLIYGTDLNLPIGG
jgi:phospholipid/cholesterol/gamma-HCH transport system permease protein